MALFTSFGPSLQAARLDSLGGNREVSDCKTGRKWGTASQQAWACDDWVNSWIIRYKIAL